MTIKQKIISYLTSVGESPDKADTIAQIYNDYQPKYPEWFQDNLTEKQKKKYNIPCDKSESNPDLTDYNSDLDDYISDSIAVNTHKKILSLSNQATEDKQKDIEPEAGPSPKEDESENEDQDEPILINPDRLTLIEDKINQLIDNMKYLEQELYVLKHRIDAVHSVKSSTATKVYNFNFS
jgi:hypothetical protein